MIKIIQLNIMVVINVNLDIQRGRLKKIDNKYF